MNQPENKHQQIVIIGAGGGGLCMAIQLKQAGIDDFIILEKAAGVGGTWWHNQYPGAECDVQSHLYSFSFEPNPHWTQPFAGHAEIRDYLNHCADKYELRSHMRFNTGVAALAWQEATGEWRLTTQEGDVIHARFVVSALGMFNEIVWPKIPGMEDFKGTTFHSARWNHDHDLTGQRVGVIGIAASAIQFVPEIAPKVGSLDLYQRTANWVVPKGNTPYNAAELQRFREDPGAVQRSRDDIYKTWNTLCTFNDKEVLAGIERAGLERLAGVDDLETRRKLTPNHPFGCRRPLFSDVYYPVFNRANVALITEDIERVTSTGIVTADGTLREVDTIVYSTGFKTTKYLAAIDVVGRAARRLEDAWSDGAQAYLGITTAGFPNLFMLYGPNTNQGCILYMIEQQVGYIVRQIKRMAAERIAWIDVRPDVMNAFNDDIQREIRAVDVWQAECGSEYYYRSASGRFVTQWPKSMDAFSAETARSDADAFESVALA